MTDICSGPTGVHQHTNHQDGGYLSVPHGHGAGVMLLLGDARKQHHHHDERCIQIYAKFMPYVRHTQACKARFKDDDRCNCGLKELRDG